MKKFNPLKKRKMKKHGNDIEQVFVKILVDEIDKLETNISARIDTDSRGRVFRSPFDLQLVLNSRSVFIEAKRTLFDSVAEVERITETEKVWSMLRDEQKIACVELALSGTPYYVIHFKTTKGARFVRMDILKITMIRKSKPEDVRSIALIDVNLTFAESATIFAMRVSL